MGVPVSSSSHSKLQLTSACAVLLAGFFSRCASSATTAPQLTSHSALSSRTAPPPHPLSSRRSGGSAGAARGAHASRRW